MIKKQVAVILLILALIFASIAVITFFVQSEDKISTKNVGEVVDDGNGKIGVNILPPSIEDKGNGS